MKVDAAPFRLGDVGGRGPAVLCIHGLTGTPYEVRPPAEALAAAGLACLGPLLPGHGGDPAELAGVPRGAWVDAVLGAWDELAATHARVYALGLSMGGVLALALAARRPVAGLVVLAAPVELGWPARVGVPLWRRFVHFVGKRPGILDDEARARHPGMDRMPLESVEQLIRLGAEVIRELPRVTTPLKLIYSRRDPSVPISNARVILAGVASRVREVSYLDDSAHVLPVDRERDRVAAESVEFIRCLERPVAVDVPHPAGES